jgi:hypothetical protein
MRVRGLFFALPVLWGATLSRAATAGPSNPQSENAWEQAEEAQARGRNVEAARLYEIAATATDDEKLRALALVSAADAALDGGQRQRALDLLARARRSAGAPSVGDLIAILDEQLKVLQEEASWSLPGSSGRPTLATVGNADVSGVADLSAHATERRGLWSAIDLNGFIFGSVSSGYDSNVSIAAPGAADGDTRIAANNGDWFATAFLMANVAHPWNHGGVTDLTYSFFQVAYPQVAHDTYNLQDHLVDLTERWSPSQSLRLSLAGRLGATLSGLRGGLAPFQRVAGLDAGAVLDESPRARVRVSAGMTARNVQDPTYRYLTGTRYDVALDQEFRPGAWSLSAGVSYRQEVVGRILDSLGSAPFGRSDVPCSGCALEAVTPYSHRLLSVGLRVRSPSERRLHAGGYVRVEERLYAPAYLEPVQSGATGSSPFSYRGRRDRRFLGGLELSVGREPAVAIRYDLTINRSQVDGADGGLCRDAGICHPLDAENHDYSRHMLTVGVDYGLWFL